MSLENMTLWVGITRNIPVAIFDEHNNLIAAISSTDGGNSMDIACRMSNCWNAFHGITSKNISPFEVLVKQRDELLAAAKGVIEWDKARQFPIPYRVRDPLQAAIAAANPKDNESNKEAA